MAYISQNGLYITSHKIQVWYNFLSHVSSLFAPLRLLPILLRIDPNPTRPHTLLMSFPVLNFLLRVSWICPPRSSLGSLPWVFPLPGMNVSYAAILLSPRFIHDSFEMSPHLELQPSQLHLLSVALHLLICLDSKCNYLAVHLWFIAHPPQFPPECE